MKSHWQSSAVLYIAIGSVGCSLGYFGFRMRWFPEASYLAIVKYTTPFAIKLGQKEMREDRGEKESNWKGSGKRALSHRLSVLLAANDILALEDELTSIGGKDPLDALEWASALGMPARQMAENRILSAWVRADSANAFSWAKANDPDFFGSRDFVRACLERDDVNLALKGVGLLDDNQKRFALMNLGEVWGASSSAEIIQAASSLSWGDRTTVVGGALGSLAWSDPNQAMDIAAKTTDVAAKSYLLNSVINGWIRGGGLEQAIAYLKEAPPSADFDRAYVTVATALAKSDPDQALKWIQRMSDVVEDHAIADQRLVPVLLQLHDSHPEIAAQVAAFTSDQRLMLARLKEPLRLWSAKDPMAAKAFVDSLTDLTQEARESLKRNITPSNN